MQLELNKHNIASPFDAIKQTRPDGSEYWSARDLMEVMGYSYWKNFENPLQRAMATAGNQGHDVERLFTQSGKKSLTGRPKVDYDLSRYAAYLVAMNGDPNMKHVAAAQSYFATQTRAAEVAPDRELTGQELMARALVEAQSVLAQKDQTIHHQAAQLEAARPAVEYVERCVAADDVLLMKDWGFEFGLTALAAYDLLIKHDLVYRRLIGERWSNKLERKVKEYEYRPRSGRTADWFSLRAQHKAPRHHNGQVRQTLYVKAIHSVDLAKHVGLIGGEMMEAA